MREGSHHRQTDLVLQLCQVSERHDFFAETDTPCVCVREWPCLLDFDFDFQVGQATTKDEDKIEEMVSLVVGGNQNS